MKKLFILLIVCVLLLSTINAFGEQIKLKCGSIESVGGNQWKAMQWVMSEIEKRSNGRLKIEYYPANQLGSTSEQQDSVISGTMDMLIMAGNLMGTLGKDYIIDEIPFIFNSREHRIAYHNSELNKARRANLLKEHGLRVIADNWYYQPHVLVSKKPILKPEDFNGFKMRVPEARGQYLGWKELGASPATVSWGEVYLALKQGVVDGVSTSIDLIKETSFAEVAPNVIMIKTEFGYEIPLMNEKAYQKLPEDLRNILVEVFNEGGNKFVEIVDQVAAENFEYFKEKGIEVYYVDEEPFREKVKGLPDVLEKKGLISKETIKKVQSLPY